MATPSALLYSCRQGKWWQCATKIDSHLPGVSRNPVAVSLWTESSLDVVILPQSDPALTFSQPTGPMMKRKVSYQSVGDATLAVAAIYSQTIPELRILAPLMPS